MGRPTARVLTLLELLQGGGTRTVADLAQRLAVDERTVRRYVDHLRELDIGVESVRGPYGGYRLARHSRLPPLMLGDEEALAVIWGLLLTGQSGSGPASTLAVQTATAKVRRVLPTALARRIDAVVDTLDFLPTGGEDAQVTGGGDDAGAEAHTLLELAGAVRGRRPVAFGYTSRQRRIRECIVEPHGVVSHRGLLYLTGFDRTRQAARTFRVDRIADLRLLEGTFTRPASADPTNQLRGPLEATPHRYPVSVRIRADVAHVRTLIPEMLASVTPIPATDHGEGWVRVFLHAERLEWVAGRLAALDRPFVIEHPQALRDRVFALGQHLIAASQPEPGT
ncbi:transcriptional regulator [Mycolicibacterium madagascariense]|uniref:Transcriptional regulator n=1 Tax=Mycolicibacterium madagascariense TaxID=212765 RepID=A0A7I7X8Z7_9MYCO|nr:WYL domain-containing protein [Mycolicibacterium madagascariense]MCV7013451.1 WYL domain-containing protein [Mycolicibacterium madagascariense]BBZ25830.1 transcriptional regulator [Mycolicibacterium madagascariense]